MTACRPAAPDGGQARQPRALYVLALTEAWERFSYYGMRALLILYMTEHILGPGSTGSAVGLHTLRTALAAVFGRASDQGLSSQIYGLYTGLAYLMPVAGGVLADRWLGQRRSVVIGGSLMAAGQFVLMNDTAFLGGLALLVLGNGLFKPNIVSQVGGLYGPGDPRRDRAYSIFYVGINVGALIAPLVCGLIAQRYGWPAAFATGGVGMVIGVVISVVGGRRVPVSALIRKEARAMSASDAGSAESRKRLGLLVMLGVLLAAFFAVFEQLGNAFSLFVRDYVDNTIRGRPIPVPWFQSANPLLMIACTPLLVTAWERQARRGVERSTLSKFSLGFAWTATAFLWLAVAAAGCAGGKVPWVAVLPFLLLLTWGELHIAPTSLSLFSRVAPASMISTMMGVYFLAGFAGNLAAGLLGTMWSTSDPAHYWSGIALVALIGSVASAASIRPVNRFLARRDIAT